MIALLQIFHGNGNVRNRHLTECKRIRRLGGSGKNSAVVDGQRTRSAGVVGNRCLCISITATTGNVIDRPRLRIVRYCEPQRTDVAAGIGAVGNDMDPPDTALVVNGGDQRKPFRYIAGRRFCRHLAGIPAEAKHHVAKAIVRFCGHRHFYHIVVLIQIPHRRSDFSDLQFYFRHNAVHSGDRTGNNIQVM